MKKPPCQTVLPWLKANLGSRCLAPLTGTDMRALWAAVQIVELFSYCRNQSLARAFGIVVREMQPSVRYLAFHAIAHVMEWSDRRGIWIDSGLEIGQFGKCKFES